MSNFSGNKSTLFVVTARAMAQDGKLKNNNDDGRLSGLDISQTERIKTQKEDESLAEVHKPSEKAQQSMKKYFERGTRVKVLKINDLVLKLREMALELDQRYDGPYRIINVAAPDTYQMELVGNLTYVTIAHANRLENIIPILYVLRTFLR